MSAAYSLIAAAIDESFPKFKRWLNDMSDRPVPFMDFDLRGLPPECRAEVHRAVKAARDRLASTRSGDSSSQDFDLLDTLVRMKESIDRNEPPLSFPLSLSDDREVQPFRGFTVDLEEVWDAWGPPADPAPRGI